MKKRTSSCILLFVFFILFLGASKEGYGQTKQNRIYADQQQSSSKQSLLGITLSEVTNQNYAIDQDTSNFSTLMVNVGALSAIFASQNLQFVNVPKPSPFSPLIIKIGDVPTAVNLLGLMTINRTNNGAIISPGYSGSEFLDLLGILGSNKVKIAILPPLGVANDGVRLHITSTLSLGLTSHYYYAFYIKPPDIQENIILCENESITVPILNHGIEYSYRLYDAQIGGNQIGNDITSGSLLIESNWESTDVVEYWLESLEDKLYPSARVKITITRNKISNNTISANQSICQGDLPMAITGVIPATAGATVSYQWQSKTSGSFTNISGATFQNYQPSGLSLATTFRRVVNATLNGKTCTSISNEVTVNIKPRPPAPQIIFKPNSQY